MICPVCKNECSDTDKRGRVRKVCSRKCALKKGRIKYNPFIIACAYCNKKIRKLPSALKHSKSGKLYCNKFCKAKAEVRKRPVICKCDYCGESLERSPSTAMPHNFCNRRCCNLWKRQFTGEETPNWKGGYKTKERERIRARKQWKELRATILSLFDFSCAKCGEFGKTLHIHHIKPWRLGGRDDIENLIPLCPKCHSKQTVKDWEEENQQDWAIGGAHTCRKGGDCYVGAMQKA